MSEKPAVFLNFVDAVTASDGDERPLWELLISCGIDKSRQLWVRATTANQARQTALKHFTEPVRMTRDMVQQQMVTELRKATGRNGDSGTGDDEAVAT